MIIPVILCGGSGTRLWPLSRTAYPKQLLPLIDDKSLLQQTLIRIQQNTGFGEPIIICNQDYRFLVAEQLKEIGLDKSHIVLEPTGKNTAPAVTLAALLAARMDEKATLLVLPADHVIKDHQKLLASINEAAKLADEGTLVTFGVVPTKPETGYGYIQKSAAIPSGGFKVKRFVEKPDLKTAEAYLKSGDFYWNSGMFMFQATAFLREMAEHAPDILAECRICEKDMLTDLDFHRIKPELFNACRSESIDYAVMEKSQNIAVVPLHSDWSDVGSWNAVFDINCMDASGNVIKGDVVADQVSNSYLHSESRLLAAVGISDLAIVETADAVLVASKASCQDVKLLVNTLKKQNRAEVERHKRDYRPWGFFEILSDGKDFKVKHLVVKPGGKLSLQMHKLRSEHWVVVKGTATVTCGEKRFELQENQSTFIPAGEKHRLENMSDKQLELVEVQTGSYFGEDDIIRLEDVYQRN